MNKFTLGYLKGFHLGVQSVAGAQKRASAANEKKASAGMNEFVSLYLSGFGVGVAKMANLRESIANYQPFSPKNWSRTGSFAGGAAGGLAGGAAGGLIGGVAGTIHGIADDPVDEETGKRVRGNWLQRGIVDGLKGSLIGGTVGALGGGVAGGVTGRHKIPEFFETLDRKFDPRNTPDLIGPPGMPKGNPKEVADAITQRLATAATLGGAKNIAKEMTLKDYYRVSGHLLDSFAKSNYGEGPQSQEQFISALGRGSENINIGDFIPEPGKDVKWPISEAMRRLKESNSEVNALEQIGSSPETKAILGIMDKIPAESRGRMISDFRAGAVPWIGAETRNMTPDSLDSIYDFSKGIKDGVDNSMNWMKDRVQ